MLNISNLLIIIFIILTLFLSTLSIFRNTLYNDAELLWSDVVSKSPQKTRPHFNLATVLGKKGLYEKALEELNKAQNFINEISTITMANITKEKGEIYLNIGLIDKAVDIFQNVIYKYPFNWEIYKGLAISLLDAGKLEEAIFYAEMSVKMKPENASTHNTLGEVYFKKGDYEKAFYQFDIAIKIDPDIIQTYWNMALTLERLGRYKEAYVHWKRYLGIEMDEKERKEVLGHIREVYKDE